MGRIDGRDDRCTILTTGTPEENWENTYGTEAYGNLPQYKKDQHVGHCYAPCPYSTQADSIRTKTMLGTESVTKVDHTLDGVIYYLTTAARGARWGHECVFPDCPYNIANGKRFFHV